MMLTRIKAAKEREQKAISELKATAAKIRRESGDTISSEQAFCQAMLQRPRLYQAYRSARRLLAALGEI